MLRDILIVYLILVNLVAFIVFGIDKRKAQLGKWRIPESTLMALALIGGSVGVYMSMKVFRHKTKNIKFYLGVPAMIVLQIAVAMWVINHI